MNTRWLGSIALLSYMGVSCASSPPAPPPAPPPPAQSAPAPQVIPPPTVVVSESDRTREAERLRAFGVVVPDRGHILADPFSPPWMRRSFVVPGPWFQEGVAALRAKKPVQASSLLRDIDVLELAMRNVYGGWDSAVARGWDWNRWFADWREALRSRGDELLPLDDAFAPVKALIAFQLDNHTNIPLGLRFGSGSRTALVAGAPAGPCDLGRTRDAATFPIAGGDPGQQPRSALRPDPLTAAFKQVWTIAYPSQRGELAAIRCGGTWIDTQPAFAGAANVLALTQTEQDVPHMRMLAPDIAYLRLPTFSKVNAERMHEALPKWPKPKGRERLLVIDVRDNDGGDAAFEALSAWVDLKRVQSAMTYKKRSASSCLYHAFRYGYMTVSSMQLTPPVSDSMRWRLQSTLDELFVRDADCERKFEEVGEPYPLRRFRLEESPADHPRILLLVNQACGSDCEYMVSVLSTLPETVIAGTNTFGVMQFIQPGFSVLPNTRLPYRIALGTSDLYGDGRSFDGYGFDVDIVLPTQEEQSATAITKLAKLLAKR